jgi:hypothetical protein
MALQAASAHLEVAAGYVSGRIWAEDAGTRCGILGGRRAAELKSATGKTVRASTPYASSTAVLSGLLSYFTYDYFRASPGLRFRPHL